MTDFTTLRELLNTGADADAAIGAPERPGLDFAGLRGLADATVARLNELGIGRNDRVAIVLPNSAEMARPIAETNSISILMISMPRRSSSSRDRNHRLSLSRRKKTFRSSRWWRWTVDLRETLRLKVKAWVLQRPMAGLPKLMMLHLFFTRPVLPRGRK
jgi:hypothetical protein